MKAVSLTNRGGRKNNEDYVGYAEENGIWCFVVCDGLGGQSCGEVASELVCGEILGAFKRNPEISGRAVFRYLERAASVLGEERDSDAEKADMSSTAVVLVTDGTRAVWAHVGDSRLYYLTGNEISLVTDDHSLAFMEFEAGGITYDEIRTSPNQNKLTRSMSDVESLNPDISDETELNRGDAFLLCTDGFWEYVNEDDMEALIASSKSPKEWLEKMLDVLHENEAEKNDNYSVIAIMV